MRTEPVIVVLTLLWVLMVAVWLYHASIGLKHDVSWHIAFIRSSIRRWRRRRKGLCPDCAYDLTPTGLGPIRTLVVCLWLAMPSIGGIAGFRIARHYIDRSARAAAGLCVECSYDLTGNISGVCPECGTKLP